MEVRNLYKDFGSGDVLRGLNLSFADSAITTILGPSGAGKSVLLKHLVGLLQPDDGEVLIFGKNLWELSSEERLELSTQVGYMFQDGGMMSSSDIYDNTAIPLRTHTNKSDREIHDIVMLALTAVGLKDAVNKFPNEISGGMRKRAAFARALVSDPLIVFFDEPDTGLDPVRTNLLNELILDMHSEHRVTYVIVTHNIATARKLSDYIALIWEGEIILNGTAEEVFNSNDPFVRQFLAGETAGPLSMD